MPIHPHFEIIENTEILPEDVEEELNSYSQPSQDNNFRNHLCADLISQNKVIDPPALQNIDSFAKIKNLVNEQNI